jgi:hypothetical protein
MDFNEFLFEEILNKVSPELSSPINTPYKQDPKYSSFAERGHNQRVMRLAEHLIRTGQCDIAFPFLTYKVNGVDGEIDLLTESEETETWFEIKYNFTRSNFEKAAKQFRKYTLAFPDFDGRAFYVSCDGVVIELSKKTLEEIIDQ